MENINLEYEEIKTILFSLEYLIDDLKLKKENGFDPPILTNGKSLLDDALSINEKLKHNLKK